jgi:OOP family OmpA-OmpF porin
MGAGMTTGRVGGWTWGWLGAGLVLALSGTAQAQEDYRVGDNNGDGMDSHLFRRAVDSKGFFATNGSDILGANEVSFGLVLDYGRNIMRTNRDRVDPGVDSLVDDSFQGTFGFNYGIENVFVLGIGLPVVLMTGDPANDIGPTGDTYDAAALDQQALSTVSMHAKLRLTRLHRGPGFAIIAQGGFPTGDATRNLGADPGFWYWPRLVFENGFGPAKRFRVTLEGGYRGHMGENPRFGEDPDGLDQLAEGIFEYGDLATFGVGLSLRVFDAFEVVGETYGTYLLEGESDDRQKLSEELLGGVKLYIEQNSYFMIGGGSRAFSTGFEAADVRLVLGFVFEPTIGDRDGDTFKDDEDDCPDDPEDFDGFQDYDGCPEPDNDNDGILDGDDACPNIPEDHDNDEDEDGCPEGEEGDRDGDGLVDSRDKCPDDPEDRDGFEDEDGCPDPDNDKDRIPDVRDRCPNDPENYNGHQDEDGCPDEQKIIIEDNQLIILDKVQFETDSAEILPESDEILDVVAATLKSHPEFLVIEVAGHADERGTYEHNDRLTAARAASVVEALKSRGIAPEMLISQGYGEYCPLERASTPAAWEKNRRVEFKIVKTDQGNTDVERGCPAAAEAGIRPPPIP